jgi:hypothetical protein
VQKPLERLHEAENSSGQQVQKTREKDVRELSGAIKRRASDTQTLSSL